MWQRGLTGLSAEVHAQITRTELVTLTSRPRRVLWCAPPTQPQQPRSHGPPGDCLEALTVEYRVRLCNGAQNQICLYPCHCVNPPLGGNILFLWQTGVCSCKMMNHEERELELECGHGGPWLNGSEPTLRDSLQQEHISNDTDISIWQIIFWDRGSVLNDFSMRCVIGQLIGVSDVLDRAIPKTHG